MWSCWWLTKMANRNVIIFADYDRPPGRKITGKCFSFPPYVVFVVVNKNGMLRAHGPKHINQQRKDPIPSDFFLTSTPW